MANLKLDLLNKVNNERYFEEIELIRLAQEPNMNYKQKIEEMGWRLREIALLDMQLQLVEKYFNQPTPEQVTQVQQAPQGEPVQQAPQGKVHQGQSHGE